MSRGQRNDEGFALISVVGLSMVLLMFMLTLLATAVSDSVSARADQDAKIAVAAAQSGIEDYASRLAQNGNYWMSPDPSNEAFGAGRVIQGTRQAGASYSYAMAGTSAQVAATGRLVVEVTGRSTGGSGSRVVTRTLTATFTPSGGGAYAYLSDKEVIDPDIMLNHEADPGCAAYYYSGRSSVAESDLSDSSADDGRCRNLAWTTSDVVDGPMHSNDALKITGKPTFTSPQTTSSRPSGTPLWWGGAAAPLGGYSPTYAPAVALPTGGTASLKTDTTAAGGCVYTGATRIVFAGASMTVLSPGTTTTSSCYNGSTSLTRKAPQIVPVPSMIYVDVGTTSCTFGEIGYPATALGEHYENDGYSEVAWDDPDNSSEHIWGWLPNYACKRGTAYVSGTSSRSVTVATQDDIVITGDLLVNDLAGSTVLGLIARACVWVWHPVDDDGANIAYSPVRNVHASVIAQQHSFLASYWTHGAALGSLTITGSVTTKYRGPMGSTNRTGTHGYTSVTYRRDPRLALMRPPYFPIGGTSTWSLQRVVDR